MALKSSKSMLEDLRKRFNNNSEPDLPAMSPKGPVDIPVRALRISSYGLVQKQQLTFFRKSDKQFFICNNHYYVPRCMQAPGTTQLDPTIRRFTWVFKKEFASNSTAAKQESLKGAYSIWYKDTRPADGLKTLSQIDGDFWMMKQLQSEPKPGETVEWVDTPNETVTELNIDWWFTAVQLPDIDAVVGQSRTNPQGCPF